MRNTTKWQMVAAVAVTQRKIGCPSHLEDQKSISRGTPEARSRLCVCRASFLMTFVMGGVPHWLPAVIEFQWSYSRS